VLLTLKVTVGSPDAFPEPEAAADEGPALLAAPDELAPEFPQPVSIRDIVIAIVKARAKNFFMFLLLSFFFALLYQQKRCKRPSPLLLGNKLKGQFSNIPELFNRSKLSLTEYEYYDRCNFLPPSHTRVWPEPAACQN
jgi:hypothetical protein